MIVPPTHERVDLWRPEIHSRKGARRRPLTTCFLTVTLIAAAALTGFAAVTAPQAVAAPRTNPPTQERALAEYRACKPLKVFLPSAGFKPLTASASQLRSEGFPPRPPQSDKLALREWTAAMSRPLHFPTPNSVCSSTKHSVIPSGNWAGHEVPESDYGSPIVYTTSEWVQPAVAGNSSYSNYQTAPDASFWTGTGLVDIIQAGCDSISTATAQYRCWTEDYPEGTDWEGPVVRPGQTVYVYDDYEGSNEAFYFFENITTGATQSFTNAAPYVGLGSADYINEVLGPYLPNFGRVSVTENTFGLQNGSGEVLGPNNIYQMVGSGGNVMSSPSFLSGSNFTQIFYSSTR